MSKKYFWIIVAFHAIVPISLFFPVLRTPNLSNSSSRINVIDYIRLNQYKYVSILLIIFVVVELAGLINAIYGLTLKKLSHKNIGCSFLLGFSSAILGAMFLSADSLLFFIICAVSFVVISYSSIKLMKLEQ